MKLIRGGEIFAAQQLPYRYFKRQRGEIEKRLTFFLAELHER